VDIFPKDLGREAFCLARSEKIGGRGQGLRSGGTQIVRWVHGRGRVGGDSGTTGVGDQGKRDGTGGGNINFSGILSGGGDHTSGRNSLRTIIKAPASHAGWPTGPQHLVWATISPRGGGEKYNDWAAGDSRGGKFHNCVGCERKG